MILVSSSAARVARETSLRDIGESNFAIPAQIGFVPTMDETIFRGEVNTWVHGFYLGLYMNPGLRMM